MSVDAMSYHEKVVNYSPAPVGRDAFNYIREQIAKGADVASVSAGLNWSEGTLRRICWRYKVVDLPSGLKGPIYFREKQKEARPKKYNAAVGVGRPNRTFPRRADIRAGITDADKEYICSIASMRKMAPSGLVGAIIEAVIDRDMIDELLGKVTDA